MSLPPGTRLGPYEVVATLGAGGMGVVYRARDSKLNRDVAIKLLPDAFAGDAERAARFAREARLLASLNHPHIASIFGLEESGGRHLLIMELVEGLTLADRIAEGRIPLNEALAIARQIAEAIEAAHEQGIIHRDLKPANIKIRPDATVKVLDFGLAKATGGDSGLETQGTTVTGGITRAGMILGTPAYMSPEQARGKAVDKRSDVWAFGCVLYEMLTGRPAFAGDTASDTIAAILDREPDWQRLPASIPPDILRLTQRCLEKHPKNRLHDIADARLEIDDALSGRALTVPMTGKPAGARRARWAAIALLGAIAGGLMAWSLRPADPEPAKPVARFVIPLASGDPILVDPGTSPTAIALSPDGAYLAYIAGRRGSFQLFLRALSEPEAKPIASGGTDPFFSPDSQWLGFSADGKLKKVSVRGGQPITLCDAPGSRGASWGEDAAIVFAPLSRTGLSRVAAAGGVPQLLTTLDSSRQETSHRSPWLLPGSKAVLYIAEGTNRQNTLMALSFETNERRVLIEDAVMPRYLTSGHLVFVQKGTLMAVAFDPVRFEMTGTPVPVLERVQRFGTSESGLLAYTLTDAASSSSTLVWVNRQGLETALAVPPQDYQHPKLSPDGQRVLVEVDPNLGRNLWLQDASGSTLTPVTFGGANLWPVWTPDGRYITYGSNRPGTSWDIFWKPTDGSGNEVALVQRELTQLPRSWSPDGQWLAFTEAHPARAHDIWLWSAKDRRSHPWLQTDAFEEQPAFSADSRWIAYVSNESGRREVYVRAASGAAGKWQVSTTGGVEPLWAPGGRELFYRDGQKMFLVDVITDPAFATVNTRMLFEGDYALTGTGTTNYDVTRDGQRFLMVKPPAHGARAAQLNVVQNWFEELKRLVPRGGSS
jgi:Tol biopolymer transport system component/tRNA A-37 threonylcarbamoyl transferase component Bud32